ncbi:hypothetical protein JCM6882_009616 [Rhodosporidiobolus microsporus]
MGNSQSSSSGGSKVAAATSTLRTRANTVDSSAKTSIDGGFLEPQSLLYNHVEFHRPSVHKLITDRKLSPFFLGLLDFEDDWDVEQLVQALGEAEQQATQNLKDALAAATESANDADAQQLNAPPGTRKHKEAVQAHNAAVLHRERLAELLKQREKRGGGGLQLTSKTEQAKLYKGRALECPICFLYYPPNMVHTRCCDQTICTECFVQIKRAEPTPTHLESEPAACPFCTETNFGCVYQRPAPVRPTVQQSASGASGSSETSGTVPAPKPRRKSFAHTEKEVVTTDMIHPDWEAKLEAMKATVARRANRRIVFRQVGDRLIPVGITSSRGGGDGSNPTMATTSLPPNFLSQVAAALDASNEGGSGRRRGSRSSRRRGNSDANSEVVALLESLGLGGGPDLEEMMVQEAMRLSQLEEEERLKKQAEEDAAKNQAPSSGASPSGGDVEQSPRTTERLLSEAMGGSALSTSPSPPRTTSPPFGSGSSASPALGALAAGSLAATAVSPSSASSFPQPGESAGGSSLARGIVGAGLAAASTSRAGSSPSPSSSPPAVASSSATPLINLDIPSTPLEAPSLDTPIAAHSSSATSSAVPTASTSSPLAADLAPPISLSASAAPSSSAASLAPSDRPSTANTDTSSLAPSLSPSAGYQPLGDESDAASLASANAGAGAGANAGAGVTGEGERAAGSSAASGKLVDL